MGKVEQITINDVAEWEYSGWSVHDQPKKSALVTIGRMYESSVGSYFMTVSSGKSYLYKPFVSTGGVVILAGDPHDTVEDAVMAAYESVVHHHNEKISNPSPNKSLIDAANSVGKLPENLGYGGQYRHG